MARFQKILCPTDFSDLSAFAIDYARTLTETYGAQLHLLHVVDEAYQYWMAMGPNSLPIGPPPDELVAAAREHMQRWREEHTQSIKATVVTEVILGRPFMEIIRYARDKRMDLIVIGTHGRSGLSHVLLGSVAERVVRKSPCPVLTIRHPGHVFEMP